MGERRLTRVPPFLTAGWYEVLLEVHWDEEETEGTRFAHTRIPGQQPLHSEAIAAAGNGLFGPGGPSCIALEVWHDSDYPIAVRFASSTVRELSVPLHFL